MSIDANAGPAEAVLAIVATGKSVSLRDLRQGLRGRMDDDAAAAQALIELIIRGTLVLDAKGRTVRRA